MTVCPYCKSEDNVVWHDWTNTVSDGFYCRKCRRIFFVEPNDDEIMAPDLYTYMKQASRTANTSRTSLSKKEIRVLNWTLGLAEVGELQNLIKKMIFHHHEVSVAQLTDEIGDIEWYLFAIMQEFGIDPYTVLRENIEKLHMRYPNGFTAKDSINRIKKDE